MFKFQYQNGEKQKSGKTFCGLQNGARGIIKRGSFRDFKSGQRDFKLGQRLQVEARRIANRGRNCKSVQNTIVEQL